MPAVWTRINEDTGEVERRCPEEMHDAVFGPDAAEEQLRREGYEFSHWEG
jgi:hypothetical protein